MNANIPVLVACGIIALASIPLIAGVVPPNPWYGVRTKQTLSNPKLWFRVNYFAGWAFLVASAISAAILIWRPGIELVYKPLVLVGAVVVSLAISLAYTRSIATKVKKCR